MFKKTITYTDYNDEERTEDFYFNLSKADITKLQMSYPGGYANLVKKYVAEKDAQGIYNVIEDIILRSYGEKSLDGKYFNKSEEMSKAFSHTEAFSELLIELLSDEKKQEEFLYGILPASVAEEVRKMEDK
jgi:hypothetical protein